MSNTSGCCASESKSVKTDTISEKLGSLCTMANEASSVAKSIVGQMFGSEPSCDEESCDKRQPCVMNDLNDLNESLVSITKSLNAIHRQL